MASTTQAHDNDDHDSLFSEASDHETGNNEGTSPGGLPEAAARVLRTRWEDVFQLSEDGTAYTSPSFLRGVPVARMPEGYQDPFWAKLEDYLAKEADEERLKAEYNERIANAIGPVSKELRDRSKMHKDNVSKHRKIREVFGGTSTFHPNQVLAKHHLPPTGLCDQEVMYMLGCKYTDLVLLANRGLLAMDPWDFLRWRIGRLVQEKMSFPGQSGCRVVKGIIFSISSERSDDPVFREIILHSARLAGNSARYGQKRNKNQRVLKPQMIKAWRGQAASKRPTSAVNRSLTVQEAEQRRAERKAIHKEQERRRQEDGSGFQGINGYRQRKQTQPGSHGGPCGG